MSSTKVTSQSTLKNQRRFRRLTFDCQAQLFSGSEYWLCQVINISLKGVKITRPNTWNGRVNSSYRLIITMNGYPAISMLAKVMHLNEDVIGVKWVKIDIDSFNRLKRIIELNTLVKNQLSDEIALLKEQK